MGRRENAVAEVTEQLTELALWLRAQSRLRGLTYAAMAEKTDRSASTLSRAASGWTVPPWRVVEAYTRACRADLRTARRLWKAARWADQQRRPDRTEEFLNADLAAKFYDVFATKPQLIDSYPKLRLGMVGLRAKEGQPSLVELEKRAGQTPKGARRLPASSLGKILRSEAVPRRRHVIAFVTAVGASPHTVLAWGEAWDRAAGKTRRRTGGRPRPTPRPHPTASYTSVPMRGFLIDDDPQAPPWPDIVVRSPVPMRGFLIDEDPGAPPRQDTGVPAGFEADIGLRPEDVAFLKTHGLSVGPPRPGDHSPPAFGPIPPLPPAGFTAAGLPIRVPRRRRFPWAPSENAFFMPTWS
ncbi:helix-turn-helix domain-containing protein [Kitasatospora sp. NPDC057692]|uniref:helix-turn-helix domain-containing protein n=1 Tax=Kitasatospora sp. NPDC057692 TaxID=3346215 RepID=UPI003682D651